MLQIVPTNLMNTNTVRRRIIWVRRNSFTLQSKRWAEKISIHRVNIFPLTGDKIK